MIKGGDNSMTVGILKSAHASAPTRSTAYTTNMAGGAGYSTIAGSQVVGGEMSFENHQTEMGTMQYRSGAASQLLALSAEELANPKEFGQAICDLCALEGSLEQKRRDLALRQDFNMCDIYKMMTQLKLGKPGVNCDDLYDTMIHNLELVITKDEVFIIFYKLDKDGDGVLNYSEVCDCFIPREDEYASMINSRGGFYGDETDPKKLFEPDTRNLIKRFIRSYVECEVSTELIRQRIVTKHGIKPESAFFAMDTDEKGYLVLADFRAFLKSMNMYPSDKNLSLLFNRLDKGERGTISPDDFTTGMQPFSMN